MLPEHLAEVPQNGRHVREMKQFEVNVLLDRYGVPYMSNMFLHDKKAAYLLFIGCNRAFMHRVLDGPE